MKYKLLLLLVVTSIDEVQAVPIPVASVQRHEPVVFEKDILPILQRNCLACHSLTEKQGDLVLESPQGMLKGGDTGPAAVPGKGTESLILKLASHQSEPVMPPAGNDVAAKPLTSDELGLLKLWIDQGARGSSGVATLSPTKWQALPKSIGSVYAVAVTPDGQYVATSRANQLFLYHVPTGKLVTRLSDPAFATGGVDPGIAHRDLIQSLAISVDGDLLASGSFREVKLWRRPRDVVRRTFVAGAEVGAVAVSADRKWIASSGPNHTIRLWNAETGEAGATLMGHSDRVTSLKFSPDGTRLVSSSLDQSLHVWNTSDGALTGQIETPVAVNAVELVATTVTNEQQPNPQMLLVSGGAENFVRTWTLPEAAPVKLALSLPGQQLLAVSPDRRFIALSSSDGAVRVVSADDDKEVAIWNLDNGAPTALTFLVDYSAASAAGGDVEALAALVPHVATTAADGSVSVWKLPEHQLVAWWKGGVVAATSIAGSTDGKQLVSGADDGTITLWDLAPPMSVVFEGTAGAAVSRIVVSPSRKLAAVAGVANGQHVVFVRNLDNGQLVHTLSGHSAAVTAVAFSEDNSQLVTGSVDKTVRVWNPGNAQQPELIKLEGHTGNVASVAFSPDGAQVLSGTSDSKLRLWNVADGMVMKDFEGHSAAILAVGFVASNQPFSVSVDKSVRFWNPADGNQTRVFNDPATPSAFAMSLDRQRVAIAGDDKLIRIYQMANGQVLQTLTGHATAATSLSFSSDGNRVVSLAAGGELVVWDAMTHRMLESSTDAAVTAAVFDFQLDRLLTGDKAGVLAQRPLRFVRHLDGIQQSITSLLFHSNGQTVFATSKDGSFRGYSTTNGQQTFATNHGAAINSLAISPNEQVLATAGENNVVRLWQTNGGGFGPQQLTGFPGPVKSVAFSLDGTRVVGGSAGEKPVAMAFELQSGTLQQRFSQHTQPVTGLAIAGQRGAVISTDAGGAFRWTTHAVRVIPGHSNQVTSLAALPGTPMQAFSGSLDSTGRRWNLENGQQLGQYNHGGAVTAVTVRPDGQRVATASDNHTAKLWNINGQQIAEMRGDVRRKTQVARMTQQQTAAQVRVNAAKQRLDAVEKDLPIKTEADKKAGETLAAANKDVQEKTAAREKAMEEKVAAEKTAIEASQAAQSALLTKLKAEAEAKAGVEAVQQAQLRANQLTAASNASPKDAELKDVAAKAVTAVQVAQTESQKLTAAVPAPTQVAQTAANAANEATQKVTQTQKPYADALAALTTALSAQNLAAQQQTIAARELEVAKAEVPVVKDAHVKSEAELEEAKKALEAANKFSQEADLAIRSVAFSPDGKLLATGGEFSSVHTWDAETGTAVAAFSGHSDALGAVAFLDDGALVSGSSDQSVRVWDLNPAWVLERAIGAVDQPQLISHRVTSLDFTSEADRLLVAGGVPSRSGELLVFDVADGSLQLFLPQAHDDVVYSARFSPDGKRIASASADKYIRTFDVASSQQHRRLEGHTNYVLGLAWKGDGSTLVSASADNTIKVWNPETGDQERTIPNFGKHVTAVRYIGETDNIVSSCGDRLVRMHTATNGGNFRNLGGATGWLHCVDITPDSNLVVAGTSDGKLFLWNGNNGQTLKTLAVGE